MDSRLSTLASNFAQAFYERSWRGALDPSVAEISIAEAYAVQDQVAALRVAGGEEVVGYKVGCTSDAIRRQFGLEEPISGRLFRPHVHQEGTERCWDDYLNCAIEPEMVLTIGADLAGTDLPDAALIDAIEHVGAGIELHHFRFWFTPPSSQELICSGGIHASLVVGATRVSPRGLSFGDELFSVRKNGELITAARASEIMGGPLRSLRWLVNSLSQRGLTLKKGSLVIPGSPVELVVIDEDTELCVEIEGVGMVTSYFGSKRR
ncbi:MAG: hypothetical protein VX293_06175 [Candidatus Latescibacterota bacterium]|nr:hypothetical protein [Candidatus Latescibacterota bacterium]